MNNYINISIRYEALASDILIARLIEINYEGFEERDGSLEAFIPEHLFVEEELKAVMNEFELSFTKQTIAEKNWNEAWESDFEPVLIGSFCAIRASFHDPVPGVRHDLVITPKMSFGTGHHATTRLMVRLMEGIDFTGKTIFDFGTGTGVLSILAEKLGGGSVWGIDVDEWSINNAQENCALNECRAIRITKEDKPVEHQRFDVILANINKTVITSYMAQLSQQLLPRGVFLISGILTEDRGDIIAKAAEANLKVIAEQAEDGWLAIQMCNIL